LYFSLFGNLFKIKVSFSNTKTKDYGDSVYFDLSVCFTTISGETIGDIEIEGLFEENLFSIESLD